MKTMPSNRILTNLIFILFLINTGCSINLVDQVRSYEIAHNSHDIDKIMSFYTDDIHFEVAGSWVRTGKEQVRGIAEWDMATNSAMMISDIKIRNDTATFKLKEGNDWFRMIGIDDIYYDPCSMIFEDGLIKVLKSEVTEQSRKAFNKAWPPIFAWLKEEKSGELSKLTTTNGEFIYNMENAKIWLSLLQEWQNGL